MFPSVVVLVRRVTTRRLVFVEASSAIQSHVAHYRLGDSVMSACTKCTNKHTNVGLSCRRSSDPSVSSIASVTLIQSNTNERPHARAPIIKAEIRPTTKRTYGKQVVKAKGDGDRRPHQHEPVSYTHLTLPTIYSV